MESQNWKKIYSKCPKCGSTDIFSVNMDEKGCNECSHKWETNGKVKKESKFERFLIEKTVTIEKSNGEYRVPAEDGYEDGAYYDNDKDSAISVAKKTYGDDVIIKFRSVPEFVGGKYERMRPKK